MLRHTINRGGQGVGVIFAFLVVFFGVFPNFGCSKSSPVEPVDEKSPVNDLPRW